jgi:general secretion pathway protein G
MSTGFTPDLPPRRPPTATDREFRDFLLRVALCLATAVTVAVTAYFCAWLSYGNYVYDNDTGPSRTRASLKYLSEDIARYREKTGGLPARLSDVTVMGDPMYPVDEEGRPLDGWGRPFRYQIAGNTYDLYSFGRDGLPGGSGLDADLHAGRTDPWAEHITLWQFTTAWGMRGIQLVCLAAGVLAFPLCLSRTKPGAPDRPTLRDVLIKNAVTAVFAVLAAVVISILHLPTGH